jgi:AmpD protein
MKLNISTGLFDQVSYLPSPNCDDYPDADDISVLVIHCISLPPGIFKGDAVIDFFLNRLDINADPYYAEIAELKVSAHLFVRRDGQVIQFVPCHKRAWHAGVSMFEGRGCCNDYSLGIELEGTDSLEYTEAQYQALAALTREIQRCYPKMTRQRIVGHSDIAPLRKTDPGVNFAWQTYLKLLD